MISSWRDRRGQVRQLHREFEASFPAGTLQPVYSYLSVTELSEYATTDEDNQQILWLGERGEPREKYQTKTNLRLVALNANLPAYGEPGTLADTD